MKVTLTATLCLSLCFASFVYAKSEEAAEILKAPVPEWMTLAEQIEVMPIGNPSVLKDHPFRPRSGGATNSRNRVLIPERGIEFEVPHRIDWKGINDEGFGVSLNADGKRLLVNTGMTTRLYETDERGDFVEKPIQVPYITYDEGPKGWILRWSWAGENVLIGHGIVMDEKGNNQLESRLYLFYMNESALARLDLSVLDLPPDSPLEVVSIGEDLEHLRIRAGDREIAVKADLKAPPRLLAEQPTTGRSSSSDSSTSQSESSAPSHSNGAIAAAPDDEQASPKQWFVTALLVLIGIALLRLFWAKKHGQ